MKINFEEKMTELDDVVKKLENGDVTLDEALELFEKGVKLTSECSKLLDKAQQKVVKLVQGDDGTMVEEDFNQKDE